MIRLQSSRWTGARGFVFLTALIFLTHSSFTGLADTIYFKDGTSLICKINEEKKIWKDITDPNFYEIEIYGGYVGFWDEGQIDRIVKDDNYKYVAKSDSLAYIRQLIKEKRLILPSAMTEGSMVIAEDIRTPVEGVVVSVENWSYSKPEGGGDTKTLNRGEKFQSNEVVATERNSRMKFVLGPVVTGGLYSDTRIVMNQLQKLEHLARYNFEMDLQRGKMLVEFQKNVIEGGIQEKVVCSINGCSFIVGSGLFLCEKNSDGLFRMVQFSGEPLEVQLNDTDQEGELKPGYMVQFDPQAEPQFQIVEATDIKPVDWNVWDSWQPKSIPIQLSLVTDYSPTASLMEEISAYGEANALRQANAVAEPKALSLTDILSRYRKALKEYKEDTGSYPDVQQGLAALHPDGETHRDPYQVSDLPLTDYWKQPLVYNIVQLPPETEQGTPQLHAMVYSIGPNGVNEKGLGDDIQ